MEFFIKNCPICEKKLNNNKRTYCSVKCFNKTKRNGTNKKCITCGKPFYVSNSQNHLKNCSNECKIKYQKGQNNPNYRSGYHKQCLNCTNKIYISPNEKSSKKYCSRKCKNEYKLKSILTPQKKQLLTHLYPSMSNEELSRRIGLTKSQINYYSTKLSIKKSKEYIKNKYKSVAIILGGTNWNQEKIYFLKENLYLNNIELTKQFNEVFNRSIKNIGAHLSKQGIHRPKDIISKINQDTLINNKKNTEFENNRLNGLKKDESRKKISEKSKKFWDIYWKRYNKHPSYKDLSRYEEEICDYYTNDDYSMKFIGEKYNVSQAKIRSILTKHGITIRKNYFGIGLLKITTKHGHPVISIGEKIIDDFLFEHGIDHYYNKQITSTSRKRYDFYLPSISLYIEYEGLLEFEKYKRSLITKLELYREFGLKLLEISHSSKNHIIDRLKFLIPLCSKKQEVLNNLI